MCMLQVLRPLLPSQAEGEVRPAALASFEAAQQLMEADPAFDRIQGPDRCALDVTHCNPPILWQATFRMQPVVPHNGL